MTTLGPQSIVLLVTSGQVISLWTSSAQTPERKEKGTQLRCEVFWTATFLCVLYRQMYPHGRECNTSGPQVKKQINTQSCLLVCPPCVCLQESSAGIQVEHSPGAAGPQTDLCTVSNDTTVRLKRWKRSNTPYLDKERERSGKLQLLSFWNVMTASIFVFHNIFTPFTS